MAASLSPITVEDVHPELQIKNLCILIQKF